MTDTYLFVINSFLAGGAERSLLNLLPRVRRADITPVIAALRRAAVGFEDEVRAAGYHVELIGGQSRIQQIFRLRKLIRRIEPALIHTSLFDADIVGRFAAVGTGVPVITSLVNTAYDPARLMDPGIKKWRLAMTRSIDGWSARHLTAHFHAISHAVEASAVSDLRLSPKRITVVERGRDPAVYGTVSEGRKVQVRLQEGISGGSVVFVTVGRQEFQKGHSYLLRSFENVVKHDERAMLLVVGREGNSSPELKALIAELGLASSVRLLGHREDVPDLLAASDVFVFPSLYEGLGGAVIEAMAVGLPVIASDVPALREVTGGETRAILVPPADPTALEHAMVMTMQDAGLRQRLSIASRDNFFARFHSEKANEKLLDLLEKVSLEHRS